MHPSPDAFRTDVDVAAPMDTLRHSHDRIFDSLQALAELPGLAEQMRRARKLALAAVEVFDGPVFLHHADEERHLFPAVTASAHEGQERDKAREMAGRLTEQHRSMEAAWKKLVKPLRSIAAGNPVHIDGSAVARLVAEYAEHARFEETVYIPFAEAVLSRNCSHMDAFGISLHLSHVKSVPSHI